MTQQDLVATYFAVAQIECPWKLHGRSIIRLLKDPASDWDHPALMAATAYSFGSETDVGHGEALHRVPWGVFLRQGQFKYIRSLVKNEFEELYDLEHDPDELINLALDADYHQQLQQFRRLTLAELKRTEAGMVANLPLVRITTMRALTWTRRIILVAYFLCGLILLLIAYRTARRILKRASSES